MSDRYIPMPLAARKTGFDRRLLRKAVDEGHIRMKKDDGWHISLHEGDVEMWANDEDLHKVPKTADDYITTTEAAKRYHYSKSNVRKLAQSGTVAARKTEKGVWIYSKASLDEWERHRASGEETPSVPIWFISAQMKKKSGTLYETCLMELLKAWEKDSGQ